MAKDWRHKYKQVKQAELLKEFEGWSDRDFIAHIFELRETIVGLEAGKPSGKAKAPAEAVTKAIDDKVYKQEWSYPTKIHFLIYQQQKPLTAADLHAVLLKVDTHYKDYDSPGNNLNVSLARMVKSGRIRRIKQPGVRGAYFVLPEWVDKDGRLISEFAIALPF